MLLASVYAKLVAHYDKVKCGIYSLVAQPGRNQHNFGLCQAETQL